MAKKVGDDKIDQDNDALHGLALKVVNALLKDLRHAPALWNTLEQREKAETGQLGADKSDIVGGLCTLKDVPEPFAISWLAKRSDMTSSELVVAKGKNDQVLIDLMSYETQMPKGMQLGENCQIKPVLSRVLDALGDRAGHRLAHFKRDGGLGDQGEVKLSMLSYRTLLKGDGSLWIKHVASDVEKTVEDSGVTKSHRLVDNCLDHAAAFSKPPHPPIKLALSFKQSKDGPHELKALSSSGADYKRIVEAAVTAWTQAKEAAAGEGQELSTAVKRQLEAQEKQAGEARGSAARSAAAKKNAEKRLKRTCSLPTEE